MATAGGAWLAFIQSMGRAWGIFVLASAVCASADPPPASHRVKQAFHDLCPAAFSGLVERVERKVAKWDALVKTVSGSALSSLDPIPYRAIQKKLRHSNEVLSPEEQKALEDFEPLVNVLQASPRFVQALNQWKAIYQRTKASSSAARRAHFDQLVGRIMDLPKSLAKFSVARLFEAKHRDPGFLPTASQRAFLRHWDLEDAFEQYPKHAVENPAKTWALEMAADLARLDWTIFRAPFKVPFLIPFPKPGWLMGSKKEQLAREMILHPDHALPERAARPWVSLVPGLASKLKTASVGAPSGWERLFLYNPRRYAERHFLDQDLNRIREETQLHSKASRTADSIRRNGKRLARGFAAAVVALGVLGTEYIPVGDSLDERHADGMSRYDRKVEMIFTSPIPHVDIRIGGNVWSYSQGYIDRFSLREYRERLESASSTVWLQKASDMLGKNHTRIELRLSEEEALRLAERLDEDWGKKYLLVFPYNDCVAQTNRAVRDIIGLDIPVVADRSQANSIAYYKLLKLSGSDRVGRIIYASADGQSARQKAMDAAVNALDTFYFLEHAPTLLLSGPIWDRYVPTFDLDTDKDTEP